MVAASTYIVDHIVHLLKTGELDAGVKHFESLGFNVISGGTHSDGLTYNALVILADGVYLELIAFIHEVDYYEPGSPERLARESHFWANVELGWVDWAHLDPSPAPSDLYRLINHRAPSGKTLYLPPRAGGRTREDGVVIKWAVTPVAADQKSGNIPFFCEDITPRRLRVPTEPPSNASHPNAVEGVERITVLTRPAGFEERAANLTVVLGSSPNELTTSGGSSTAVWTLSSGNKGSPVLELRASLEDSLTSEGISRVTFWGKKGSVEV